MSKQSGALAQAERRLLGEKIFRQSFNQPDLMLGLKSVFLPGYGQSKAMHVLRDNYLKEIRRLGGNMRGLGAGDPRRSALINRARDTTQSFRGQKNQIFEEIGSVAQPRLRFFNRTLPITGGLGAGAAVGMNVGNMRGSDKTRDTIRDQLKDVPLMTRLKYFLNPDGTF